MNKIEQSISYMANSGNYDLNHLLKKLPGVYPTTVLQHIKNMISKNYIKKDYLEKLLSAYRDDDLAISKIMPGLQHPLDFNWRFTPETCTSLLDKLYNLTYSQDNVLLLGTPSLLKMSHGIFDNRKVISVDKNDPDYEINKEIQWSSYKIDLLSESTPQINATAVVADPPWYYEYFKSFIWESSKVCAMNGYLLLSIPSHEIRPEMNKELKNIYNYAFDVGFAYHKFEKKALTYTMPLFEKNALKTTGLMNIAHDWRTSDLIIFQKNKKNSIPRPIFEVNDNWIKLVLDKTEFRIKEKKYTKSFDPTLISFTSNDICPTVSRRYSYRKLIDVWTSGNRIYSCNNTSILICILNAIKMNKPIIDQISLSLHRKLTKYEIMQISNTTKKIKEIIKIESCEFDER